MTISERNIDRYMIERKWATDHKSQRKQYLLHLARQSKSDPDIASKIGGILIYNQVMEEYLTDIITKSLYFIKARIWPVTVELDIDLEKATFGKMIDHFKEFATIEPNREQLLVHLAKFNTKRNQVVHDLFDINNLGRLGQELNEYAELADNIIKLLIEYENQVCHNFRDLENSKRFA